MNQLTPGYGAVFATPRLALGKLKLLLSRKHGNMADLSNVSTDRIIGGKTFKNVFTGYSLPALRNSGRLRNNRRRLDAQAFLMDRLVSG